MTADLSKLRSDLGWSQAELAERLGCAQSTVSRIENGQPPTKMMAKLIAQVERRAASRRPPSRRAEVSDAPGGAAVASA